VIAGGQGRESAAVAHAENEDAIEIDEVVFLHGVEGGLPAFHLALEIRLGTIALALALLRSREMTILCRQK
jgi:hypothetical protein